MLAAAACVLAVSAQAQIPTGITTVVMPSPLGIVLSLGQWLFQDGRPLIYYVEVAGDGATAEEARANGFRLAVEQAVGSLIASETVVQDSRIKRDEIISYASGYVDKFEIANTRTYNSGYRVTMKVWVGRSALANRLLAESRAGGDIDGDRASARISTLRDEQANGDRLLATVLGDFPRRAFDVKIKSNNIQMDQYRQGRLSIPYELQFDWRYLQSLYEALRQTSQLNGVVGVSIMYKPPQNWISNDGGNAMFDNNNKTASLWRRFVVSEPRLLLEIIDINGHTVHQACYLVPELDQYHQYNRPKQYMVEQRQNLIFIDGTVKSTGILQVNLGVDTAGISRINQANISVILAQDCSKN